MPSRTEQPEAALTTAESQAWRRAVEAAEVGAWEIDLATDRATMRSGTHHRLFGDAVPPPSWGFAAAAQQVVEEDRPAFVAAVEKARETGVLQCNPRVRWPDGSIHVVEFRGRALSGQPPGQMRMSGTVVLADDRLGLDERLHDSEAQLHLAVAISAIGVFDWDIASGRVVWSEELCRIYGIDPLRFGGTYAEWRPLVLPEDLAPLEEHVRDAFARRDVRLHARFRIRRQDGDIRHLECIATVTYAPDGSPLRAVGVNRDTTAATLIARALAQSRARQAAVFDQAAVGIVDADLEGRWMRANRRMAEMLGYDSPQALEGRSWLDLTHPEDRAAGIRRFSALKSGQISHYSNDKRFLRKDGTALWANATVSLVRDVETGEPAFLTAIIVDAEERKQAEAALAAAEERLRFAQDAAGAGLWDLDVASGIATCSAGYCRLYGLDPAGAGHRTIEEWLAQVHPEDRDRARAAVEASYATGRYECEYRAVWPDGTIRWLAARGRTHLDAEGRPTRFSGLAVDITPLRKAELRLRIAMEATHLATWEVAFPSGEATWSENHFPLFGYPPAAEGRASFEMWHDRVHPEDVASVDLSLVACRNRAPVQLVYRIRRADDGAERWMQTVGSGFDPSEAGVARRLLGVTFDVTDREVARARLQDLQAELLHVSRVADAGVMASGLAHELAQPLTAAASALHGARLAQQRAAPVLPPDLRADLEEALDLAAGQLDRAGKILKGLRGFVQPQAGARRPEALRPIVEDAISLAVIGLGQHRVTIRNGVSATLPRVMGDGVQLRQLLFNLLRNAGQAIQETAGDGPLGAITVTASVQDASVEVAVSDNGPGLKPSVADRLFEPFVTTKRDGMGIGLSICRSIVEAHGGSIRAEAPAAGGTVFRFTLPLARPMEDDADWGQ